MKVFVVEVVAVSSWLEVVLLLRSPSVTTEQFQLLLADPPSSNQSDLLLLLAVVADWVFAQPRHLSFRILVMMQQVQLSYQHHPLHQNEVDVGTSLLVGPLPSRRSLFWAL